MISAPTPGSKQECLQQGGAPGQSNASPRLGLGTLSSMDEEAAAAVVLLATCTLGTQAQSQVYLQEEFEDGGKRPGWGQRIWVQGVGGRVRRGEATPGPTYSLSPASVVYSSNSCSSLPRCVTLGD